MHQIVSSALSSQNANAELTFDAHYIARRFVATNAIGFNALTPLMQFMQRR